MKKQDYLKSKLTNLTVKKSGKAKITSSKAGEIDLKVLFPGYMKNLYEWLYANPKNIAFFDNSFMANLTSFWYANKLNKACTDEIASGDNVLQAGATYGNQILKTVYKIGNNGCFDLIDITPIQVIRWTGKLKKFKYAHVYHKDAEKIDLIKKYDAAILFMLLHEVPDKKKSRIINEILEKITSEGKVIFIDYHKPSNLNLIGWFVKIYNRIMEPFAESLWQKEISDFADKELSKNFIWYKQTYFFGLYQKVVAIKKNN